MQTEFLAVLIEECQLLKRRDRPGAFFAYSKHFLLLHNEQHSHSFLLRRLTECTLSAVEKVDGLDVETTEWSLIPCPGSRGLVNDGLTTQTVRDAILSLLNRLV